VPALSGIIAALAAHPEWRYERAAEMAARCAELLAPHVDVITPPGQSTLVSFRAPGDPEQLVAALQERGVVVREIPKRNIVRASCGWWTNEDDLQRLVAGLAG
jgi:selenocysteine lyase/cysteine desulfurase